MDYNETLKYLYSQLPVFQRVGKAAYKDNLENTLALDAYLGSPHRKYPTIHVAGTNGKGSVSHMIAAILQAAGYKTGLYTSPHLLDFRERIKVNANPAGKNFVVSFIQSLREKIEILKPSFFELTVAMAFEHFKKEKVDIAVIEVGMGGRLDSTNIITPLVSIITNIGMDHTTYLGSTLQEIAGEKAGIIKPGVPVVIGRKQPETHPVFLGQATLNKTSLVYADEKYSMTGSSIENNGMQVFDLLHNREAIFPKLKIDLPGAYQLENSATVIAAMDILIENGMEITKSDIYRGLERTANSTGLRGRWEVLGKEPLIIADVAHNTEGLQKVFAQLSRTPYHKLHVVFGMVNDKDSNSVLEILPRDAIYYFTKANIPRAMDENNLTRLAREKGLQGRAYPSVKGAFLSARKIAGKNDLIFTGGSTFVVAEILAATKSLFRR